MRALAILLALLAVISLSFAADDLASRSTLSPLVDGTVTWTPRDYSGFYYDIDNNLGSETLELNISGRQVEPGKARYVSAAQEKRFMHREWGSYSSIGFLGHSYLAGYGEDCAISGRWDALEGGLLIPVLMDDDSRRTVSSQEEIVLQEGYRIRFSDADEGLEASLFQGDRLVDSARLKAPGDYVYRTNPWPEGRGEDNVSLIAVHVDGYVRLQPASYCTVRGIFQISQNGRRVEKGQVYGLMTLASAGGGGLEMSNRQPQDLAGDVQLMNGTAIKTTSHRDADAVGHIYLQAAGINATVVRGQVQTAGDGETLFWTPHNFAGFFYDLDRSLGSEQLEMTITGSRLEEPGGITYTTTAQERDFQFQEWGRYYTMGFLGQGYFAGYSDESAMGGSRSPPVLWERSEDVNTLVDEQLLRVLMDSNEQRQVRSGEVLDLEEGYQARIEVDKDCKKAFLTLTRDGNLTDQDYLDLPGTYTYQKDLGDTRGLVILAIHLSEASCSPQKTALVDGIFQISDQPQDVSVDRVYGLMRIRSVWSEGVSMDNKDASLVLHRNMDVELMPGIHLRAADQEAQSGDPIRLYIYSPI
ncbi:MAG: hypothetical protein GKC10_01660 [Methanosarcinales archaeon]|nr:hypothetical protein [Methanosarcinales archaeon]